MQFAARAAAQNNAGAGGVGVRRTSSAHLGQPNLRFHVPKKAVDQSLRNGIGIRGPITASLRTWCMRAVLR
jgi:hypothetical protein